MRATRAGCGDARDGGPGVRPVLSVCLVTWEHVEVTAACLRSLFRHTRSVSFEVILVDNGSTDDTVGTVSGQFPAVRIVANDTNLGFPRAVNQAVCLSRAGYVALLNNDTVLAEDALGRLVAYLDTHPDVGLVGCRLRLPDGQVQHSAHADRAWWHYLVEALFLHRLFPRSPVFGRMDMTYMDYERTTRDVDWLVLAAVVARRRALDEVGLLDERIVAFCEDWEWCVRLRQAGWRVVYHAGAEIAHHLGMSSHSPASPKGDRVRAWSWMTLNASATYVYRKLHPRAPVRVLLFSATRRLFNLSRFVTVGVLRLLGIRRARAAPLAAYWWAAVMPDAALARRYLHPAADAAPANPPA